LYDSEKKAKSLADKLEEVEIGSLKRELQEKRNIRLQR